MTFEEIFKAGDEGKLDIFKAYDLLEGRKEEICKLVSSDQEKDNIKSLKAELDNCENLQSFIIQSEFDNVVPVPESANEYFSMLKKYVFLYEKAKTQKKGDDSKKYQHSVKTTIALTIDMLKKLDSKI